jgi:hypothetical protein
MLLSNFINNEKNSRDIKGVNDSIAGVKTEITWMLSVN